MNKLTEEAHQELMQGRVLVEPTVLDVILSKKVKPSSWTHRVEYPFDVYLSDKKIEYREDEDKTITKIFEQYGWKVEGVEEDIEDE